MCNMCFILYLVSFQLSIPLCLNKTAFLCQSIIAHSDLWNEMFCNSKEGFLNKVLKPNLPEHGWLCYPVSQRLTCWPRASASSHPWSLWFCCVKDKYSLFTYYLEQQDSNKVNSTGWSAHPELGSAWGFFPLKWSFSIPLSPSCCSWGNVRSL